MIEPALRAIADSRRREILRLIGSRELSAGEIASHFDVTRPAISQHLGILASAGLVTVRREGTRRLFRTRPDALEEVRVFLERFWDDSLARLKEAAETEERRSREFDHTRN